MQISLIQFSIENFKSFKERVVFSMVSRKSKHTFESNNENLLRTSLIYGPNASGKTTLLEALVVMRNLVRLSANISESQENIKLPYSPFMGSIETQNKPTFFEIIFALKNTEKTIYKYSFSFTQNKIISENLVEVSSSEKEISLFSRNEQKINTKKPFDNDLIEKVRPESLFLSVSAQFNNKIALTILDAFNNLLIFSALVNTPIDLTVKKIKSDEEYKKKFLEYLKIVDFCITGAKTQEIDTQGLDFKFDAGKVAFNQVKGKADMLILEHPVFDTNNEKTSVFDLNFNQESTGTQKFIATIGPIIDVIESGKVLCIDEFDNSLHPLLTKFIVDMFESEEINKNNAQLIATTHDTSLLSYKEDFIRDQFWFTEKDQYGSAKLFSLAEFDEIRNDTEFSRKYLEGRFGALPFIGYVKK